MNTLTIFTISLVFIWSCSADDEEVTTRSQETSDESSHESSLTFYSCVACGGEEVITAYEKCTELKSENVSTNTEKFERID
ncbi:hypothetical protein AVEN_173220-1 [Araneus ventricosus]|uniref:Uncharacterized protein n=1 Tax=Araneus ventricosus TaxID=182803 RepID=A0A4Y2L6K3_ARAVE|nr:hypothetical protein AVEN_173220-1 [Araneus ventricosus]